MLQRFSFHYHSSCIVPSPDQLHGRKHPNTQHYRLLLSFFANSIPIVREHTAHTMRHAVILGKNFPIRPGRIWLMISYAFR